MSELISGKEALIALANGVEVQGRIGFDWHDIKDNERVCIKSFITELNLDGVRVEFRLKPKTITLNGIEVPAPFEPKAGEQAFYITPFGNYDALVFDWQLNDFGYWRTEAEIKQVVSALRSIFKGE